MVNQEKQYYRIDPGYIVNKPWYNSYLDYQNHNNVPPSNPNPNYPAGASPGQYATSQKVYSLNGSTNRTGLEMVIKVMAGDKVDIFGRSYHTNYSSVSNGNSTPLSILQIMSGLISSPSNAISGKGVNASQLESWNAGLLPSSFIRGQNYESGTTIPKAYINYIFLDEQFRYVSGGASRVGNYGEVKQHWSELSNLAAQKNGYLLVYVSNESNFTVFFDNLQVVHKTGPIVEETHYYPFGLVMQGISSKIPGSVVNRKKYNGKEEQRQEFGDGSGLEWLDYGARIYDAQIGRMNHVDPMAHKMPFASPYAYCLNNPINMVDPDGRIPYPITIRAFAPFNYFGGGFHGDGANRGFTTSSSATARVHQKINFDTDKTTMTTNAWSSPTSHRVIPGSLTETPSIKFNGDFTIKRNGDTKTFNFATHVAGSNPMVPGAPPIDIFSNFSIKENKKAGILDISGKLTGDNFPSTEAFVTDPKGNNVFIGVGFYEGSPFSSLDGENQRDISSFNFSISTDKKGNFTGVKMGDKSYSIAGWNKMFQTADPHKNEEKK
jgi:RHS repeat-associated protein